MEGLFQRLSEQAKPQTTTQLRPVPTHRARIALVAAAAAAVLVAGTTVATENLHHPARDVRDRTHTPRHRAADRDLPNRRMARSWARSSPTAGIRPGCS